MKFKIFLILYFLSVSVCFAQNGEELLKNTWSDVNLDDTTRLDALNSLIVNYYSSTKKDSALILSETMLRYAQKKKLAQYEILAHISFGKMHQSNWDHKIAIENFTSALNIAEKEKDSVNLIRVLYLIGHSYNQLGDYINSFKTFQRSLEICSMTGDREEEGNVIGYLGITYANIGEYNEAEKYYLEQLRIAKEIGDKSGVAAVTCNLGGVYEGQGDMTKAVEYWAEGIKLAKEEGIDIFVSIGLYNIISYYIDQKQFSIANGYFDEFKENTKDLESPYYSAKRHKFQCLLDFGMGNYTNAINECEQCLIALKKYDNKNDERVVYRTLYEINKQLDRSKKALEYFEKYQILKDSSKVEESKAEIQRIVFNNQLAKDSIAQVEEKRQLNESYIEEVRKKNRTKNIFLIIGLAVLLMAVGLYFQLRFVRRSKEKLNIEKEKAEKSEQVKQDFLANMSHEIRTPMNAVLGMTDLVLNMPLGDKQKKYLEGIKRSGDNLLHIINDILDLSKIEAGKMELDNIDFSIRESVDQVKQMLQHRASEKDLELLTMVEPEVDDIVVGDPMRLNQVLINLIGNAVKFTLKGSVSLEVRKVEKGVQFNIIDTGIGIPEDKLKAVFESFSQANTSDTRKYGGTGLGLSISQQLIELMDSTIEIESKEGYGSTFSFIINFEKGSVDRLNQRISKDDSIDGSILDGIKILLVDDNEYNIIVARDTLMSKANVEVHEAINGQEAIDLVKDHQFDVILMDVQMPIMNGYDATQYIRTNFESPLKDTPIIALTASVVRTDLDKCIDAGMNSYIPKPFKAYQLISAIAEVLGIPLRTIDLNKTKEKKDPHSEVTDLTYLRSFCEGDEERMKKYIKMYITSAPQLLEKIGMALKDNDLIEIANQVHGFKTKFVMMGMTETKELANSLEQICREGTDEHSITEKISILVDDLEKALVELENFMK